MQLEGNETYTDMQPVDRQCDAKYSDCRVVSENLEAHGIYIGLLAVAEKRSAQVNNHPRPSALSREPANV